MNTVNTNVLTRKRSVMCAKPREGQRRKFRLQLDASPQTEGKGRSAAQLRDASSALHSLPATRSLTIPRPTHSELVLGVRHFFIVICFIDEMKWPLLLTE